MNKINLFIKSVFSLDNIVNREIEFFNKYLKTKGTDYFLIIDNENYANIILIHIFEVYDCRNISKNKNIILYLHFKPNLADIKFINNLIKDKCILLILSHFSIENFKNHKCLVWPINEDLTLDFKEKKKCNLYSQELFSFEYINLINNNLEPIIDEEYDIKKIYHKVINNKKVPHELSYTFFIKKLYQYITEKLESNDKYIFLPLLNIINDSESKFNSRECLEICSFESNSDLCYNTLNKITTFYPWALSLSFDNLQEGIYVKKTTLLKYSLKIKELNNHYCLYFLEIPDIYKHNNKWDCFIHNSEGDIYKGIPPLLDFVFSDKNTYIKKPDLSNRISNGIIVYIDNIEHLPNLRNLIKKIDNKYNLEINFDIDLMNEISEIKENYFIKKNPIDLWKFQNSNQLSLELKLYLLLISRFKKCLFLDLNLLTWGDYSSFFDKLDKHDTLFFKSITQPLQIKNLFTDIDNELYLNEYDFVEPIETGIFGINIIECWIPILLTLGFINKYHKKLLINKSIELLYLSLLISKKNIFIINCLNNKDIKNKINKNLESGIKCHGYLENNLFIGYPIYNYNDFNYTFIPFWYEKYKSDYITKNLQNINWKYSDYFDCIVCEKKDCYKYDISIVFN